MSDPEQQLKELSDKVAKMQTIKIRAEERLRALNEQLAKVEEEFTKLGVSTTTVSEAITNLQVELDRELAKINNQIPPHI